MIKVTLQCPKCMNSNIDFVTPNHIECKCGHIGDIQEFSYYEY